MVIFKWIKKIFTFNSIRSRLIASNIFLTIFSVGIVGILLVTFINELVVNDFKKENRLIISVVSSITEDLVKNSSKELKMIANCKEIGMIFSNNLNTEILNKTFTQLKYLNNFYIFDKNGEILFNYSDKFKDSVSNEERHARIQENLKEKVEKFVKSYSRVGRIEVQSEKISKIKYDIEKKGRKIQVFQPLFDSNKKFEAVIVGEILFDKIGLGDILYNIYKTTANTLSIIAYKDGTILSHTFSDELGENIFTNTTKLKKLRKYSKANTYLTESVIYRGEKYISITYNLNLGGSDDFLLIIYRPYKLIYELVEELGIKIIFAIIFSIVLAVLFGVVRAIRISAPIKEITLSAQDISKGYYNKKIERKTNDEIGILAEVINEMAISLEGKIKELEESKRMLLDKCEEVNENAKKIEAANISLKKSIDELITISNFAEAVSIKSNVEEIAKYVGDVLVNSLGYNIFSIKLFDEEKMSLRVLEARGLSPEYFKKRKNTYVGEGVSGLAVKMGRIIEVFDMETDPRINTNIYRGENIKSVICFPMITKGKVIGVINLYKREKYNFTPEEKRIISIFANQTALAIDNISLMEAIKSSYLTTIKLLSSAIDARDSYTQGHSERVTNIALCIGKKLGLRENELEILKTAGLLHDIGKIGVRDEIIKKRGKLNIPEFEEIKEHPLIGNKILERVSFLQGVSTIIKHHHERYDGSGYPDGLKGEEIPFLSSILAVADAFDAMSSDRPYRKAMGLNYIIDELKRCSNTQFDPAVVYALLDVINEGEIHKGKETWVYKERGNY